MMRTTKVANKRRFPGGGMRRRYQIYGRQCLWPKPRKYHPTAEEMPNRKIATRPGCTPKEYTASAVQVTRLVVGNICFWRTIDDLSKEWISCATKRFNQLLAATPNTVVLIGCLTSRFRTLVGHRCNRKKPT
jgi:hypothetical protein